MSSNKTSIIYESEVKIAFSDLDMYNHVNSKHYVDYVITSRLYFFQEKFGITIADISKKNIAFYLNKSEVYYLRPINGLTTLKITSHIEKIVDEKMLIPFSIRNSHTKKEHSRGTLHFTVVDTALNRSVVMPEELMGYFFE